jgi:hypothetical protein
MVNQKSDSRLETPWQMSKSKNGSSCAVMPWRTIHEAGKGSLRPTELGPLLEALGAESDTPGARYIILSPENT